MVDVYFFLRDRKRKVERKKYRQDDRHSLYQIDKDGEKKICRMTYTYNLKIKDREKTRHGRMHDILPMITAETHEPRKYTDIPYG